MAEIHQRAQAVLKSLHYDFRIFTIEDFIAWIERAKGRKIFTFEWHMPVGLFGAWMSDAEEPKEYIFYRQGVETLHRNHIILRELCHLWFGHPTVRITLAMFKQSYQGQADLPFIEYARLRSPHLDEQELEAETLASLIQDVAIRHRHLDQLTRSLSSDEKIARFLKDLGLAG